MITQTQKPPLHPVFECEDDTPSGEVLDFLFREDLQTEMSFSYRGGMYVFRTREERIQFGLGLRAGMQALHVRWIVTEGNEPNIAENGAFGVEVNEQPYFYYKHSRPDVGHPSIKYREINKREFGETLRRNPTREMK